jgi:Uma2 family endonuclease
VDILLTLPDDGYMYEVVEGILVRAAGSGNRATTIALAIGAELRAYACPRRLGVVTGADGVYIFAGAETGLIPDAGYYSADRAALIKDEDRPLPFAPDLAMEVASPSQDAEQMGRPRRGST